LSSTSSVEASICKRGVVAEEEEFERPQLADEGRHGLRRRIFLRLESPAGIDAMPA
jgi:hypothetical protein